MNTGSIADFVFKIVDNVPSNISGNLISIVEQQKTVVENYTGETIDSNSIDAKYQPALIDLTIADALKLMETVGADVSSISLGELSISKGANSALMTVSQKFKDSGMEKLKQLGEKVNYYATFG